MGLRSGVPVHVPALTVNRLCGSGFQSVINGAQDILLGESNIVLTGGAESMSSAPCTPPYPTFVPNLKCIVSLLTLNQLLPAHRSLGH